ncbi:YgaP family membrane protein [Magnetococcus sp. PR-3]|uniref:YgaP family membrane protein n=1 Tax=Magnetococcus sp. PR-3 TaxID=3120355 RepID=UPI002FCE43AB
MNANVGGIDRILRIVAGIALIVWAVALEGPIWAWIGIVPLATGAIKFCPLYPIFGISSCAKPE